MIDDYALGQFIQSVFLTHVPLIVGFVLAILTLVLLYLAFREIPGRN